MLRTLLAFSIISIFVMSCRSTRQIRTAIAKKDTVTTTTVILDTVQKTDSLALIRTALAQLDSGRIDFNTFSAKINVDYQGMDGKKYDVNANLRMQKDSAIWISITAVFGIEGLRALITKDSVKILNKQDKVYTARSVAYLQEITRLPLDLRTLQEILIGNPVFIDSNVVSYARGANNTTTLVTVGEWFKNFLTINANGRIENSKLDDVDRTRSRTCNLSYSAFENKQNISFSTKRRITVSEKGNLDIKLDFKGYEFNETLTFPFSVPKNYKAN